MANHYYDATGVLILDRVTPVITTLFGGFNLDASYPGDGRAYIARMSETNDPQWSNVLDALIELADQLALSVADNGDEPSIELLLKALARHFGAEQNEELQNLIEHHAFDDSADLESLFLIASCLNDGHNLVAIQFEGCWHCDKPRLFEFGGDGCFISREVNLFSRSIQALELGGQLRSAILANDIEDASARIIRETLIMLTGITDPQIRARVRTLVADRLLADPPIPAAG